jgi:hypothetical protein
MSPSDNASGAFYGQARISRRGRPGLRPAVWRAVWPMLPYNPVMAAKYQAMTAGTGAAPGADRDGTGPQQVTAAAAAPEASAPRARRRQGQGRLRGCAAALDLLPGRPRRMGPRRRLRRRRQPGGGSLTSAFRPAPRQGA